MVQKQGWHQLHLMAKQSISLLVDHIQSRFVTRLSIKVYANTEIKAILQPKLVHTLVPIYLDLTYHCKVPNNANVIAHRDYRRTVKLGRGKKPETRCGQF